MVVSRPACFDACLRSTHTLMGDRVEWTDKKGTRQQTWFSIHGALIYLASSAVTVSDGHAGMLCRTPTPHLRNYCRGVFQSAWQAESSHNSPRILGSEAKFSMGGRSKVLDPTYEACAANVNERRWETGGVSCKR